MKKNYHYDSRSLQKATAPTVFVTKGRQRVKQYDGNIVYLKNGDEFELELFNPTSNKVLAEINLNGKNLGPGIVLRPGERVFLERYFDEAKKFLFETYEVDNKNSSVKEAIKNNGVVDVKFYNEYLKPYIIEWPIVYNYHYYYNPCKPYTNPYTPSWTYNTGSELTIGSVSNSNTSYTYSSNSGNLNANYLSKSVPESKETGRVEKGSYSDQHFDHDSTSFNYYCSWKCTWKILPESQKAFTKEDLKVFCTNCGAKRKKSSHKFCPNCGIKF